MGRATDPETAEHRKTVLARELAARKDADSSFRHKHIAEKLDRPAAMISQWSRGHSAMDYESARRLEIALGLELGALDGPFFVAARNAGEDADEKVVSIQRQTKDQIIAGVIDMMEKTDEEGRRACYRACVLALDEIDKARAKPNKQSGESSTLRYTASGGG